MNWLPGAGLFLIILISWGIAFFEYLFQVPANRIGFVDNGGPFSLWQLKVIQEVITLTVFTVFTLVFFKDQPLKVNHVIGFGFLVLAVYFIFKKLRIGEGRFRNGFFCYLTDFAIELL